MSSVTKEYSVGREYRWVSYFLLFGFLFFIVLLFYNFDTEHFCINFQFKNTNNSIGTIMFLIFSAFSAYLSLFCFRTSKRKIIVGDEEIIEISYKTKNILKWSDFLEIRERRSTDVVLVGRNTDAQVRFKKTYFNNPELCETLAARISERIQPALPVVIGQLSSKGIFAKLFFTVLSVAAYFIFRMTFVREMAIVFFLVGILDTIVSLTQVRRLTLEHDSIFLERTFSSVRFKLSEVELLPPKDLMMNTNLRTKQGKKIILSRGIFGPIYLRALMLYAFRNFLK